MLWGAKSFCPPLATALPTYNILSYFLPRLWTESSLHICFGEYNTASRSNTAKMHLPSFSSSFLISKISTNSLTTLTTLIRKTFQII